VDIAALGFLALLALAFFGLPLGLAMIAVGVAGFSLQRGFLPALSMTGQQILDLATNYDLSTLPMFLLMGALVHRANLSEDLFRACNAWIGQRRGGLAMATIGACGGFAAVCGSSMATAATMARIAIPPMRSFGYADSLGAAAIAAGGTLGILIPPSVPMVIYGLITQADIGKLFIAGIIPGLAMIAAYILAIATVVRLDAAAGPRGPRADWAERFASLGRVWGVALLFVLVLGGIYFGVCTPTEAAGVGSAGALLFALARGQLNWRNLAEALLEAGRTTTAIFVVMFGALVFANFLTLTGLIGEVVQKLRALDLAPLTVILAICLVYLVLGCIFESLGMMLITIPVFFPVIVSFGMDPIWFGIVVVIVVEIGLITPPVGMNVFVVKSVIGDIGLGTIFAGIAPFVAASLAVLLLVVFFPEIALFLPRLM
jgi:tripartite ATP-independent transporter DctM subunit